MLWTDICSLQIFNARCPNSSGSQGKRTHIVKPRRGTANNSPPPQFDLRPASAPALLREHAEAACVHGVVHDPWWMSGRQPSACIENTIRQGLQLLSTFRHVHPHEPPRSMSRIEDRRKTPATLSCRLPYRDLARTSLSYQLYMPCYNASQPHHSVRTIPTTELGGACYVSTLVHTHR